MNLCRTAGFRAVRLRGDTDFSQTEHLDGWDDDGVKFVFGIDAMPNLYELVESLPEEAWTRLQRPPRYEVQTQTRARPENVKESIVVARKFKNIRLQGEYVAEFDYRPTACDRNYRVVVVWKDLEVTRGQLHLFDDTKCFFYITNDRTKTAAEIVFDANHRCDQENLIAQQKNGVRSLTAPLDTLESNEAYMVIASLLVPVHGRWREKHTEQKHRLLRMDFATFRQAMINIPAQIIRSGRQTIYRLLSWNPWESVFFRLWNRLSQPLLC